DGSTKQITNHGDAVDEYTVSPDGKYAIYLLSSGGNEQYDIYLINLETFQSTPLLADKEIRYDNPIWADNDTFIFISNEVNGKDFYIFKYNLKSAQKTLLIEKKGYNILTDALSADDFLFFTFKGNNVTVPYRYFNGKAKKIRGATKKRSYVPIGYLNNEILMKTNENSDLEYLELWNKGKKRAVYNHKKWGVTSAIVDKNRRAKALFCTNNQGYSSCFLYEKGKAKLLPLPKGIVKPSHMTLRGFVYTSYKPNQIYTPALYDFATEKVESFGYTNNNDIDVTTFVSPTLHEAISFDKTSIPYFLYLPKKGKKPFKTIVYFHGGPSSQFRPYFITTFQYYLSQGYAVVAPNVRGSAGYGQKFMDADNYKKRMDSVKDGRAIVQRLLSTGISSPGNFIAMGGSYGGFMSVASMAQYPGDYACGVDSVGVVDFVNFLTNTKAYRRKLREIEYGPLKDKKFLKSISPTNMVDTIRGALFIAHGANDPRVPVSDAYILQKKMEKAGKKVEILVFDDEGHGFRKKKNRDEYYGKVADFIKRECGDSEVKK
ncbi:S9 family peptidase, partial [bacterium]|nr:S9 family peptidase [bacterium]